MEYELDQQQQQQWEWEGCGSESKTGRLSESKGGCEIQREREDDFVAKAFVMWSKHGA